MNLNEQLQEAYAAGYYRALYEKGEGAGPDVSPDAIASPMSMDTKPNTDGIVPGVQHDPNGPHSYYQMTEVSNDSGSKKVWQLDLLDEETNTYTLYYWYDRSGHGKPRWNTRPPKYLR